MDSAASTRAMLESVKEVMGEAEEKFEANSKNAEAMVAEANKRRDAAEKEAGAVRAELARAKARLKAIEKAQDGDITTYPPSSPARIRRTRSCDSSTMFSSPCSPRRATRRRTPSRGSAMVA